MIPGRHPKHAVLDTTLLDTAVLDTTLLEWARARAHSSNVVSSTAVSSNVVSSTACLGCLPGIIHLPKYWGHPVPQTAFSCRASDGVATAYGHNKWVIP